MARISTPSFILEIPLLVNQAQERELLIVMECGRRLYNAVLGEALKRLSLMRESKKWQVARKLPKHTTTDKKHRSNTYKDLTLVYGFNQTDLEKYAKVCCQSSGMNKHIGSHIVQKVVLRAYTAVAKYLYGLGGKPRFKGRNRPLKSLEGKNNQANLVWKSDIASIVINKLIIPVKLANSQQDIYQAQALANTTKYCRILWRLVKGKRYWYTQLIMAGYAPIKANQVSKQAVVGLDIGPSTVATFSLDNVNLQTFCSEISQPWKVQRRVQRALDRSRRKTNPQCFNDNGTWKQGSTFQPSKHYLSLKAVTAELERKLAATRKTAHGTLSNVILRQGNTIQTESISYKGLQKNYGRSVKVRAPSMFVKMLSRKAERAGGKVIELNTWKLKMSQYDHISQTYTKKPLSQRKHQLRTTNGELSEWTVQRDVYSAYLAYCVVDNQHNPAIQKTVWRAQEPVLKRMGFMCRTQLASVEPLGKTTLDCIIV